MAGSLLLLYLARARGRRRASAGNTGSALPKEGQWRDIAMSVRRFPQRRLRQRGAGLRLYRAWGRQTARYRHGKGPDRRLLANDASPTHGLRSSEADLTCRI